MKKLFILIAAVVLAACEKPVFDEDTAESATVTINITVDDEGADMGCQHSRTTRAALEDVCSRINVAVFDGGGTKLKSIAQSSSDSGFGSVPLSLAAGSYKLVVIAHNGSGSATITSEEKVTFANNKVTDTFYYYGVLTVNNDKREVAITLKRAVAMVRLLIDGLPDDVATLKFYYTGGSSTFSPFEGLGNVNSKQTEYRPYNEDGIYEIYTFPHSTEDAITKLTITALDAGDNMLDEIMVENIPVTVNRITEYSGAKFGGGGSQVSMSISVNPSWAGIDHY